MPKPFFDNIDDVQGKFVGTMCLHNNQAVYVKSAHFIDPDDLKKFSLLICPIGGRGKRVALDDPNLNYTDYSIGYANGVMAATWWYRRPLRQYRQGLKSDQMGYRVVGHIRDPASSTFNFDNSIVGMLENRYPSFDLIKKQLVDESATSLAFHRDFALSWDFLHGDFVIQYRGEQVGILKKSNDFLLLPETSYLTETLRETLTDVQTADEAR